MITQIIKKSKQMDEICRQAFTQNKSTEPSNINCVVRGN